MLDCVFCKIIRGEIPAQPAYEDADVIVIRDIQPKAPIHLLGMPKVHIESLASATDAQAPIFSQILQVLRSLAAKEGLAEKGYKVIINVGKDGGQTVPHLHIHLLGGERVEGIT